MSAILLLIAVVCFAVKVFNGHIGDIDLIALGLVFFAASFLVGPVRTVIKRADG
jgi:hypothetical protein